MPEARLEVSRRDPYRSFTLNVPGITGINQVFAPTLIEDTECQDIVNLLPIGGGVLRKVRKPLKIISLPVRPVKVATAVLQGTYKCLILCADGSVYVRELGSDTATQVATANTLSGDPAKMDIIIWQNSAFYVIDYDRGYFKYYYDTTDATWKFVQVSSVVKGTTAVIWQGRVFVGKDSIVMYSAPLDPEDFSGTGSGYFDLVQSFPKLKMKVKKIVPYIDHLYILGDSAIIVLTGSTISNDPTTWYLTQISDVIGSTNANNITTYQNFIYLQNEKGLYRITPGTQEKFDYKIALYSKIMPLNYQTEVVPINNLLFYLLPVQNTTYFRGLSNNLLAFCIDIAQFFILDFGFDVYGIYRSYVEGMEEEIFLLGPDGIYAFNKGDGFLPVYILTKSYDLNDIIEKYWQFLQMRLFLRNDVGPQFKIKCMTELKSIETESKTITVPVKSYVFGFTNTNVDFFGQTNNNVTFFLDYNELLEKTNVVYPITFLNNVGMIGEIEIIDETDSYYDFFGFAITGQLGRRTL